MSDAWTTGADGTYDLEVHGPNGFYRHFAGGSKKAVEISADYTASDLELRLEARNTGSSPVTIAIKDRYTAKTTSLRVGASARKTWDHALGRTRGWYDVTLTVSGATGFEIQYAGHLENGKESITDP